MTHHGFAFELEQQFLGTGHPRARTRCQDDSSDWQECCGKALEGRAGGPDPLDLDTCANSAFGIFAQALAVAVDQHQAPTSESRHVRERLGQADDGERPAIIAGGKVLQG